MAPGEMLEVRRQSFGRQQRLTMSHRTGNTKEFDKRWRKDRERKKAARAARRKNRGKK